MRWVNWALHTALQCLLISRVKAFLLGLMHSSANEGRENALSVVIETGLGGRKWNSEALNGKMARNNSWDNDKEEVRANCSCVIISLCAFRLNYLRSLSSLGARRSPPPPCQWIDIMCSCVESPITSQGIWVWASSVCVWVCRITSASGSAPWLSITAKSQWGINYLQRAHTLIWIFYLHSNGNSVDSRARAAEAQNKDWTSAWTPDVL